LESDSVTTTATGATVQITILDSQNNPVEGATVTLENQTAKSDKQGVVSFTNISAGKQAVLVSFNGKKTSKDIQVTGASTQAPELFKISVTRDRYNPLTLIVPLFILLVAALFAVRPWSSKFAKVPVDTPPVVSSDKPAKIAIKPNHSTQLPGKVYAPDVRSKPKDPDKPAKS
jgi:hypothetical protein